MQVCAHEIWISRVWRALTECRWLGCVEGRIYVREQNCMMAFRLPFSIGQCMDGKTLATVSYDRKVKLWSVSTHQELVTIPFNTAWQAVAAHFTPDGRALAISYLDARGSHTRLVCAPSFEEIAATEGGRMETWNS